MRTLFIECNMGAAGDMLMAALLELHDNPDSFIKRLNGIGIKGVSVSANPAVKCGISGTHVTVLVNGDEEQSHDHVHHHSHEHTDDHEHPHNHEHPHDHEHQHNHEHHGDMHGITHMINTLAVSDKVKKDALAVYELIAEAESHVHGVPVTDIHFHEVGTLDALTDIVGVCMLVEELGAEHIIASPVHVGSGQVRCAHGIIPVPAPATAHILRDVPVYGGGILGELCTPTGAALLRYFAKDFGMMPVMKVARIGYGMGNKDFEQANCVRAFLGETGATNEHVTELVCNLDDMTPESIAYVQQLLLDKGALDVYTTPIGMKKGRAGILFTCMCRSDLTEKMTALIFKHTTTLGMRENISRRYTLHRAQHEVETKYGTVRIKTASGYGINRSKPEYEDIAKIARDNNLSLEDVRKEIE